MRRRVALWCRKVKNTDRLLRLTSWDSFNQFDFISSNFLTSTLLRLIERGMRRLAAYKIPNVKVFLHSRVLFQQTEN